MLDAAYELVHIQRMMAVVDNDKAHKKRTNLGGVALSKADMARAKTRWKKTRSRPDQSFSSWVRERILA